MSRSIEYKLKMEIDFCSISNFCQQEKFKWGIEVGRSDNKKCDQHLFQTNLLFFCTNQQQPKTISFTKPELSHLHQGYSGLFTADR